MNTSTSVTNRLIHEKSPYLLQHANNPVDWYPWGDEAFEKAKREDKPVFLSIGYSTCHWCHVMAHESFEDKEVAEILNKYFVSIKVDKEERPDIDSIYMAVCMEFTGSGGWPTSIFKTPEQKPFFAGTYFPKTSRYGSISFPDLLLTIHDRWQSNKKELIQSAEETITRLKHGPTETGEIDESAIEIAVSQFKKKFDRKYGGFGNAPKFPTPHNLLFLLDYYENSGDKDALDMVETTLIQMYKGGIFDHIGYGFSRYSTDRYFLVPHFEKMLYDNALLIMSYSKAYNITNNPLFKEIAEKTAEYVLREMTSSEGGFYSAQDADSDGVEGKYYVFKPDEIISVLGDETGKDFNVYFGITNEGNFEGKNIPNILGNDITDSRFDEYLPKLREYRKSRTSLNLDDKILTSWNSLMIAAFALLYRVTKNEKYLQAAEIAEMFISTNLCENGTLYVSYRDGKRGSKGFLDDYAFYIFALIGLYEATLNNNYLIKARQFCDSSINFYDETNGGFYIYGKENEQLIINPKETYDGAIPSGNSVMAYNLVKVFNITKDDKYGDWAEEQLKFVSSEAIQYPSGYSFYLLALSIYINPVESVTVVLKDKADFEILKDKFNLNTILTVLDEPTDEYKLLNDKTTFYVCKNHSCMPPTNEL